MSFIGSFDASYGEQDAIGQAQKGNADGFEYLYLLHRRRIYTLCLRMTGNSAKAEDLVQETFLQLFRKISTFRGESAFSTWLHRLAVNVVLMHLRRKHLVEISLEPYDPSSQNESTQKDGLLRKIGNHTPARVNSVERIHLVRAVEQLSPGHRAVFILHDMEGYQHREIAAAMGCSYGNSKLQLHRARMKLRSLLQ